MSVSLIFFTGLLCAGLDSGMYGHAADSLQAVTVTADRGITVSRCDTIPTGNSFTVSGLLLHSPGLQIGDYGGMAGLKSVSLRGFGSPHTSIYIDGARVGNVQSGQNDLGMLGIENMSSAVIDYAQNSISFNTRKPVFRDLPVSGTLRFSGGSFNTYLPSLRMDFRLSDKLSLSANAAGIFSKGNFRYGQDGFRLNNDIRQFRGGLDLFGGMQEGEYHIKGYANSSERGTPGSVSWPSEDRQKDMNAFIQGRLRKKFSRLYTLSASAKGSYDGIEYSSSWGNSIYGQTEFQLNTAHAFRVNGWLALSLVADIHEDILRSTSYDASRTSVTSAAAAAFRLDGFSADVALEFIGAYDRGGSDWNTLSPSVSARYRLTEGLDITAFARRAYRVPTFNELYYEGFGNPELSPEDAWLSDLGLDFRKSPAAGWTINGRLDGFFNILTDKIISSPSEADPNIWLPYNIGKVRSAGADACFRFGYDSGIFSGSFETRYSLQDAKDRTPGSPDYGRQIPYQAKHTLVLEGSLGWKGLIFNPLWSLRAGRKDAYGDLSDWNTLDVTIGKTFSLKKAGTLAVKLSGRNLLDCRYELSSGYPMPGRSIIGGMEYRF